MQKKAMGKAETNISAAEVDERGIFFRVLTPQLGPCGTCTKMTANFISRDGRTQCTECDLREGRERKAG